MQSRRGYAEIEGEAILRRKRKAQKKKELIQISIVSAAVFGFVAWAFWMYLSGNTPIWK